MATVTLTNVTKVYAGGIKAVNEANIEVKDREFVVLVGPSGCGKSTTLRMVAGLEEITEGTLQIDNRVVNNVPPKDRDIAMVFQNYALYPHMTVYENMAFGLKLRKMPKTEIDQRVKEAADILGLHKLLDRKPKALSGGQRQRVALGRAIVRKPKVFLFDEPLSNLDAKLRVQMRAELAKLHTRLQSTMIYVTHDQTEAMTMGDRIVVMKDGFIQQIAKPLELYERPINKFVAGFIGSPSMNFLECTVEKDGSDIVLNEGTFRVATTDETGEALVKQGYVGKKVIFGIRPEDIYDKIFVPDAPKDRTIMATVEVVEPMGSEVYLHLTTGRHVLTARVDAHDQASVNQELELVLDMAKSHVFNVETELAIV